MFSIILRGGRLTKYKGKAASFAPGLGISSPDVATGSTFAPVLERMASALGTSVSARALATRALAVAFATAAPLAMTVTGANAGVCTETFAGSGIFVCSGPATGGDATQTLAAPLMSRPFPALALPQRQAMPLNFAVILSVLVQTSPSPTTTPPPLPAIIPAFTRSKEASGSPRSRRPVW